MTSDLPRGLSYDPVRRAFRVRLYWQSKVLHLSYHRDKGEALEAYAKAKEKQAHLRRLHSTFGGQVGTEAQAARLGMGIL